MHSIVDSNVSYLLAVRSCNMRDSVFHHSLDEVFAFVGCYAMSVGSCWWTFCDNPLVPLQVGLIGCPETSVNNYQSTLHNNPEERRPNLEYIFAYHSHMAAFAVVSLCLCLVITKTIVGHKNYSANLCGQSTHSSKPFKWPHKRLNFG
jgi:hypothetical protein